MSTATFQSDIRVSLEELALLLNLMGHSVVAKGLLVSQLGDISVEEERGRLLAANHTLLAKNIMKLDEGQLHIDPAYTNLLSILIDNDFAVRCFAASEGGFLQTLTYYIEGERIVEQRIDHGAVHSFRAVFSLSEATEAIGALLELDAIRSHESGASKLSQAELQALTEDQPDAARASDRLQALGWTKEAADSFAEDNFSRHRRAGLLRAVMNPEQATTLERGFMLLTGKFGRSWLMSFDGNGENDLLLIRPATANLVRQEIITLLKSP